MVGSRGYRVESFGGNRRVVAESVTVGRERNTIHLLAEADLTNARGLMAEHRRSTGEGLSLTALVVTCLARTLAEFPRFNAFRKGRRLILLDDTTISVLLERDLGGEKVPDPLCIQSVQEKTLRQVNDELRAARDRPGEHLGATSGTEWIRWVPAFLLRSVIRIMARNISIQKRFGVVGVTSVGMFSSAPIWPIPITNATVTVAVGSLARRPRVVDGRLEEREHLLLTLSFNHDLVDGAPAARFTSRFVERLQESGDLVALVAGKPEPTPGSQWR